MVDSCFMSDRKQISVKQLKIILKKKKKKDGGVVCTPMAKSIRFTAEIKPILWSNYPSVAQETQTGALYKPRGVGWGGRRDGDSKGRGNMYTYGRFMFRLDRKQQNSVKQLSLNKKNNFYKRKKG